MWCAISGDVYYIAKPMVFYRILSGPTSAGARLHANKEYVYEIYKRLCDYYDAFDEYTDHKYADFVRNLKEKEEFLYLCRIQDFKKILKCDFYVSNREELSFTFKLKQYFKLFFPHVFRLLRSLRNEYLKRFVWKQSNVGN